MVSAGSPVITGSSEQVAPAVPALVAPDTGGPVSGTALFG